MGNKIWTRILLGRGKGGIYTLVHLGVTFTGPRFSLQEVSCARHSRGYAALSVLERQCAHFQQDPQTKQWLFDTLMTPTLLYGAEMWGPSLNKGKNWKWCLVSMIACMIRSKASMSHGTQGWHMKLTCWTWRESLLALWNATMVWATWRKGKCTRFQYSLDCPIWTWRNWKKVEWSKLIST